MKEKKKKKNQIEMKSTSAWGISIPFDIVVNKLVGSSFLLFCLRFVNFFLFLVIQLIFLKHEFKSREKKSSAYVIPVTPPKKKSSLIGYERPTQVHQYGGGEDPMKRVTE